MNKNQLKGKRNIKTNIQCVWFEGEGFRWEVTGGEVYLITYEGSGRGQEGVNAPLSSISVLRSIIQRNSYVYPSSIVLFDSGTERFCIDNYYIQV